MVRGEVGVIEKNKVVKIAALAVAGIGILTEERLSHQGTPL